jgi:hypothetical protein
MDAYIDHHSWLVNNNLFTDRMKDDLAMAGHFIIEDVLDVYPSIDFNAKVVDYKLIVPDELYDNLKLLENFKNGENIGFWKGRRLKKFLEQKRMNDDSGMGYELEQIANDFVKNYLNGEWRAEVKVFKEEKRNEIENFILRGKGDSPTN